jgi:hypothetical protein
VNVSFRLSDGDRCWHIKVARDADAIAGLRRCEDCADRLYSRYLAPRLLAAFTPTAATFALVFEWIEGDHPHTPDGSWLSTLQPALRDLHGDHAWAARLHSGSGLRAIDTYRQVFLDKFEEDLRVIRRTRPAFVRYETVKALEQQVRRLTQELERDDAFQATVASPTHGDLWRNNVLIAPSGRVVIVDWDDLSAGDPALDWAMVLSRHGTDFGVAWEWLPEELDAAARRRVSAYARAIVLDTAIDALADWIEAVDAPDVLEVSRAHSAAEHVRAVACLPALHGFDDGIPEERA